MCVRVSVHVLTEDAIFKGHGMRHLSFLLYWCCRDDLIICFQLQMCWGLWNTEDQGIICCSVCDWVFLLKVNIIARTQVL